MKSQEIFIAKRENYTELITLWEESVRATHYFLTDSAIEHYKLLIFDYYFDTLKLYCIRKSETIIGFIGLKEKFIQMLFVNPNYMGKGIGTVLINYAIHNHHATTVDVNEQNTAALGFYKKIGFLVTSRTAKDAAGMPYPVLSLTLGKLHSS